MDRVHALTPTGINQRFDAQGMPFADYVTQTTKRLYEVQARLGREPHIAHKIVAANQPYLWTPHDAQDPHQIWENGILLVHGLYDSPFTLQDLAEHFREKGFVVYGLLLPGHGTVPGDLLNCNREEWIKAVHYGVEAIKKAAKNVFVAAFSLGATLTLIEQMRPHAPSNSTTSIKAMILIAPALHPTRRFIPLARWNRFISSRLFPNAKWYAINPQLSYAKYESFPCDAGYQAYRVMKEARQLLRRHNLTMPLFVVASLEDETVRTQNIIDFFMQQPNPMNRLLLYTNQTFQSKDPRIMTHNIENAEKRLVNLSHIALCISPNNVHFGQQGEYQDFQHYPDKKPPLNYPIYQGAASKENLAKYPALQRITFNPDFTGMVSAIDNFLHPLLNV